MSQRSTFTRVILLAAVVVAIVVVATIVSRKLKHPPAVQITPPATAPATKPSTEPIIAVEPPPRTYFELLHREFPKLATTQPIDQTLNMRDWGHFLIPHPLHIDRRGGMWITRADAEETETVLGTAPTNQVYLTRERVLFAHWFYSEGGDWVVMLVTPAASGAGFEIVSSKSRQPIGTGNDYDWSRAFSIPAQHIFIVPRHGRVSVFSTGENISESVSPMLAEGGTVQIQMDARGLLAWVPPEEGHPGSKTVVRFVDGKWSTLGAEQNWPANILHLIPLADGTVLQIIAEDGGKVRLAYALLDVTAIDEPKVTRLIIELGDPAAEKREKAFAELTQFGPGLWPIAEKMMDSSPPEAQERLKSLLKSKLSPQLGGMELVDSKLRVLSRFSDGGALFLAENGVQIPHGDAEPQVIRPAWLVVRGSAVQPVDADITQSVDLERAQMTALGSEWIITDAAMGPQRYFGGALVPLLRKSERRYSELVGIDARGRYVFREPVKNEAALPTTKPSTGPTSHPTTRFARFSDSASLVIDPTLPDPLPRLPVWHIIVKEGSVGWTADGWPVMKAGGAWALGTRDWRALDEKSEKTLSGPEDVPPPPAFKPDISATLPSTNPATNPTTRAATSPAMIAAGEKPLMRDAEGNWYFDGKTSLKVVSKAGKVTTWPLPGAAAGDGEPWLVRTQEGLLFLFNQPGRLLRIRPTPKSAEPFELDATFSRNIPNEPPTRMWLDPGDRLIIAFGGNHLAICFPLGFIPPATDRIIPAGEQDVAGEE
jgi:hypothetical protein